MLTRDGEHFRLAFPYERGLVERVRELPYATFSSETRTWSTPVCSRSVRLLRSLFSEGVCDVSPDDLLDPEEQVVELAPARLRAGSGSRPFRVQTGTQDQGVYARLRSIPGASWDRSARVITYPATAAAALGELVDRGVLDDPEGVLSPAEVSITFDTRTGRFVLRGDPRAQASFDRYFPQRDVVAAWEERGLDVAFCDPVSEEIYRGEVARAAPEATPPAGLAVPLFPYQTRNVAVALARSGLGVFDQPGLGKTATGIAVGHELVTNRGEVPRVLVVCPATLRTQWSQEITRFTGCDQVVLVDGSAAGRSARYLEGRQARWVIVHWDVLARDLAELEPLARGALVIFDEAHRAKDHTRKRSKAAVRLSRLAARRLTLTGTPVVNRPDEWYAVLNLAVPGCLGPPLEFLDRYMHRGRFGGFEGARNLDELARRSKVFYIRHTKDRVAHHLPPLRVEHQPLDPNPRYAALLRRIHREAREEIRAAALSRAVGRSGVLLGEDTVEEVTSGAEMTAIGMLRLVCSSPRILLASDSAAAQAMISAGIVPDEDGPKLDWLRDRAREWQQAGERAVIFTFSRRMADLISDRFRSDGIRHVTYTGATSTRDRDAAVRAFTTPSSEGDEGPTCFVATDAAAEGLNLGTCCSLLVNVDIPWQPSVLEQRSNRIHRVDGTHPHYLVINLTLVGTMEEGLVRLVARKADLADQLMGEDGARQRTVGRRVRHQRAGDLSAQELQSLLDGCID